MKAIEEIYNTDIYLIDQFMKGRVNRESKILDAGCGSGRNIRYLLKESFNVTAFDPDATKIELLRQSYTTQIEKFSCSSIEEFESAEKFDFIICNAVLHFARDHEHFEKMFEALINQLSTEGIIFIRMTSNIGIERFLKSDIKGVYHLPDDSFRYLITERKLQDLMNTYQLEFLEPLKTVNVANMRSMSTFVLKNLR